jgi:poly-gamma-glutamate biosynthesis protein PgsC/CapC
LVLETVLIGILAALVYTEITGVYPGGIIVPAYIALYLDRPLRVLATLLVALVSLACFKLLSRYLLLFGRRRFVCMILLGAFFGQAWLLLQPGLFSGPMELRVIGFIIPGLLANNFERQKFVPTLASLITVSVVTYFLSKIIMSIF